MIPKKMVLILVLVFLGATGCARLMALSEPDTRGASSSLVNFLYPGNEVPPKTTAKARLQLPLRVGLAFVPGNQETPGLTEADKLALLENVKSSFSSREYVRNITIIPDTYLRGMRGAAGLDQLARLYELDVMALVSYDQTVNLDDRKSSVFYWTILGAYLVKGSEGEVSTFVDLAVVDVNTKKLLLRAAGISSSSQNSTLVDVLKDTRISRRDGFVNAMASMISNFDQELNRFEEAVSTNEEIEVVRPDAKGGGVIGFELLLLLPLLRRRMNRSKVHVPE